MSDPADGPRERRSRCKSSGCEGANTLKSYFSNLALRDFDEIFHNADAEVVHRVLKPSKKRYFGAVMLMVGILLNTFTITKGFVWSLNDQQELYQVLSDRTFLGNFSECRAAKHKEVLQRLDGGAHHHDSGGSAEHWQHGCGHIKRHSRYIFVCLPAFWELFMLLQTLFRSLMCLRHVFRVGQDTTSEFSTNHEHRHHEIEEFKIIDKGITILDSMTSISSIKRLPDIQKLLPDLISNHKLMKEHFRRDGTLSLIETLTVAAYDIWSCVFKLVQVMFAMFALYIKLVAIQHLLQEEFIFWDRGEWLAFVGFTFQIANLMKLEQERKDAFLFFVFTGEDAELQDRELEALEEFKALMKKKLFQKFGVARGFAVALTITSKDLQRIVLTEKAPVQIQDEGNST